jgi:hypothetical protein
MPPPTTCIIARHDAATNNLHLKNNLVQGSGIADYYLLNVESSATNISQDGTSPDVGFADTTVTFAGAGDYHLHANSTAAKDVGTDLSADLVRPLSTDIDRQGRPSGAGWDIGADEYVAR